MDTTTCGSKRCLEQGCYGVCDEVANRCVIIALAPDHTRVPNRLLGTEINEHGEAI